MGILQKIREHYRKSDGNVRMRKAQTYVAVLRQYEEFEQKGLLYMLPNSNRVAVSLSLANMFADKTDTFKLFLDGVALYATYRYTQLKTSELMAKLELEAIRRKSDELGRELNAEEQHLCALSAKAEMDASQVIEDNIEFDIIVVGKDNDIRVVAHSRGTKMQIVHTAEE